jgi:uncharacterized membrane protein SpoIIM required for sporulation
MVSGAVVISSQATSTRAANLLASFIIVPMSMLLVGESTIMFWARYPILWWAIFGQVLIAGLLVRTGIAYFNREELLGREMDTLNIRWGWKIFSEAFSGPEHTFRGWLRGVGQAIKRLRLPLALTALALLAGVFIGMQQASVFRLPPETLNINNISSSASQNITGIETLRFLSIDSIPAVWLHNLKVIAASTLLGLFSFGVIGLLVLMTPFAIIGYFMANAAYAGISPGLFLVALVLPHGILEIPAIIITGAAVLHLGATLSTPAKGRTMGEALLQALADWAKITLGVALPLLLLAAFLEIMITPRVAIALLGP